MARGGFDIGSVIKIGAVGVGGYFLYDWWQKRPTTVIVPATTTGAGTGTTAPAFNSLDAIAKRIMAAAGGVSLSADGWNFYLQRELPIGKAAPDPADFLGGTPRETLMTFAQYWGAVTPKLKTDLGLSGLGMLAGLGMVRR